MNSIQSAVIKAQNSKQQKD